MSIFRNRPLALGCAVFLISLYTLYHGKTGISVAVLTVGVLLSCAVLVFNLKNELCTFRVKSITAYLIPVVIALILSSILSLAAFQTEKKKAADLLGTEGEYTVIIEGEKYESFYRNAYIGTIKELNVRAVILTYNRELDVGNTVKASITLESLSDGKYGTGAAERYLEDGILLGADCDSITRLEESGFSIRVIFNSLNKFLSKRIKTMTDRDTAAIISAVLLGDKSELSLNNSRDFARLGISHILALSGMHLSIVALMISGALTGAGLHKKLRYVLTLMTIFGFMCLTGFSASVLRAGLMLTVFYIMFFFRQRSDFITGIFVSVTVICIISPYSVFSVSLLLSFFAMLGCALSSVIVARIGNIKKLKRLRMLDRFNVLDFFIGSLITTTVISLITLPIVFLNFDFISLISPIANLVFIPLFTLLLYLSPFLLLFGKIPLLGRFIAWLCELLTSLIMYLTRNLSLMRGIVIPFNSKLHPYAVILIFLSIMMLMAISKRRAYIPVISLIVGCCLFAVGSLYTTAHLSKNSYVFASCDDDGDITYIRSKRKLSVVDSCSSTRSAIDEIYGVAGSTKYCEIEHYIVTDYSHYSPSALEYLSSNIVVRNLHLPDPVNEKEMELYNEICERVKGNGVTVRNLSDTVEVGSLNIFMGPEDFLPRSEKRLVAFSIEGETSRYTYVGASVFEGMVSGAFAGRYIQSSDVVYFGAYGPKYMYPYSFDISGVDYCVVSPAASDYFSCDNDEVRRLSPEGVFVLK